MADATTVRTLVREKLVAAVQARLAYWDAEKALEDLVGEGSGDKLSDYIGVLASGSEDPDGSIDDSHVDEAIKLGGNEYE